MDTKLPLAVFGLVTDVQYANYPNKNSNGKMRYYRDSLNHINKAIKSWQAENTSLKLILQLGDLIDGKCQKQPYAAMAKVLQEFEKMSNSKVLHVWGNHEMYNFSRYKLKKTPLNTAKFLNQSESDGNYFTFDVTDKIVLICLDYYEIVHSTLFNRYGKKTDTELEEVNKLLQAADKDPVKEMHNKKRILFSGGIDWLS